MADHGPASEESAWSDDEKHAAYDRVDAALADFFRKYPDVDTCGRMATINAFLKRHFPSWHFVGFYVVTKPEMLQIGPYQGDVLATALIKFGKGQCGLCAEKQATQRLDDVAVCSNYIPCDDVTRSEIVVPVFGRNAHNEPEASAPTAAADAGSKRLIAVLDIDRCVRGDGQLHHANVNALQCTRNTAVRWATQQATIPN
jgi:GAF domain-containing protein